LIGDGRELELSSDLPLGLNRESKYTESKFRLKPGEQLTLVTDGVPEARNAQGELLGFEKTAAISTKSAEDIAEVAQEFGQVDDVTVVKLTWQPILISPSAALMFSGEPNSI
jgi:serine phosphatase RsbU (regulator of sigma subunit)